MERCEFCKKEYSNKAGYTTRTTDRRVICIDCYHKIFNIIFKGAFSYEEGLSIWNQNAKYQALISEYLLVIKKLLILNNLELKDVFKNLIDLEELVGLQLYNKFRQPILYRLGEHSVVIKYILSNNLLNIIFKEVNISNINITYDSNIQDILTLNTYYTNYNLGLLSYI